jgi:uncharacterized protein (DUF2141 family)
VSRRNQLLAALCALVVPLGTVAAESKVRPGDAGTAASPSVGLGSAGQAVGQSDGRGQIKLTIKGFRSSRGRALIALFRNDKGFPGKPPKGAPYLAVPIVDGVATGLFEHVPPGAFAVTVLHDEDDDGKMKTSFFGIPKEGLGFSRDARARFGPPDYEDCQVLLQPGRRETLSITMLYY